MVHAPSGVAGIGQGLPLQFVQGRRGQAGELAGDAPWLARCPSLEIGRHRFGVRAGDELGAQYRLTIAQRAGWLMLQAVPPRGLAASPPALLDALCHARQPFGLAGQAVPFVHCLEDGAQQHAGDGVGVGDRFVEDAHAGLFGLVLKDQGQVPAAGNARGVQGEDNRPGPGGVAEGAKQGLEAGPVVVLARLHRVGKLGDDGQALLVGVVLERPALGVQAQVMPIFGAAQVARGLAGGGLTGWGSSSAARVRRRRASESSPSPPGWP